MSGIKVKSGNWTIEYVSPSELKRQNPFDNLLEMVSYYLDIYLNQDYDELLDFAKPDLPESPVKLVSNNDMFTTICTLFWDSINPDRESDIDEAKWLDFDKTKLEEVLKDSFFDDYNETKDTIQKYCKREYPMLDVYSFVRLQVYACEILPIDQLWNINFIWTFEDFINQIIDLGWFKLVARVYKALGFKWFCDGAADDPIKYKWALRAIYACRACSFIDDEILKKDLACIYQELIISLTIRNTLNKNKGIVDSIQDCLLNFDNPKIIKMNMDIQNLKSENAQLINEKIQLNEGMQKLREQISELREANLSENETFDEIATRIQCLSPQGTKLKDSMIQLEQIWGKLAFHTKQDINASISMLLDFKSFDMAVFPMIRSLEREMDINFFRPFHASKLYRDINVPMCVNKKYKKTHDALIFKQGTHPTLGNIAYIGRAMTDVGAQNSSNLIKAFQIFLNDNRKGFISICKSLEAYRMGTKKYRLVDIRNGIAHGDESVIENIDKKCCEEVVRLLYQPPIEIMVGVIKFSMKFNH